VLIPKLQKRRKPRSRATIDGEPVSIGSLRAFVIGRDGDCLAKRFVPGHVCRGRWGSTYAGASSHLTLEHVKGVHDPEDPRQDNERHCVTLCYALNGASIASHGLREKLRGYLRALYPECRPD
jgi:hypothetical protein